MADQPNRDETSHDSLSAVVAELGLTPKADGSRVRDNVIQYPTTPGARESLALIKAFTQIRDPYKRSKMLDLILQAADR